MSLSETIAALAGDQALSNQDRTWLANTENQKQLNEINGSDWSHKRFSELIRWPVAISGKAEIISCSFTLLLHGPSAMLNQKINRRYSVMADFMVVSACAVAGRPILRSMSK
jgi:hypothetical protein